MPFSWSRSPGCLRTSRAVAPAAGSGGLETQPRRRAKRRPPPPPGTRGSLRARSAMAAPPPPPITALRMTDSSPSHWNRRVPPPAPPPANGTRASAQSGPPPAPLLTNGRAGLGGSGAAAANGRARAAAKGQRAAGPRQTGGSGGGSWRGLRARPGLQVRRGRPGAASCSAQGTGRASFPFLSAGLGGCPAAGSVPVLPCTVCRVCCPRGRWAGRCPVPSRVSPALEALAGGGAVTASGLAPWGCRVGAAEPWARREGRPSWGGSGAECGAENGPCVSESRGSCAPVRSHWCRPKVLTLL